MDKEEKLDMLGRLNESRLNILEVIVYEHYESVEELKRKENPFVYNAPVRDMNFYNRNKVIGKFAIFQGKNLLLPNSVTNGYESNSTMKAGIGDENG